MRYKDLFVPLLIAALFLTVAVWAKSGQSVARATSWEYKILNAPISEERLNQIGAQGWEAFATDNNSGYPVVYFKRPK